ncbi:MAG: hypothetical protein HFJ84_11140 [Clostridiales bacterium]|nr:hypothetical protein [Clostridiales bacterium]
MTYQTSRVAQILTDFAQYFSQSAWYSDLLVWLSQLILNLMKTLVDAADTLLDKVYILFDFTRSSQVTSFLKTFYPYLWIPFAMALVILGYQLIMNKEETKPKVVQNLLIAVLVITAMPNMMLMINDFTKTATTYVKDNDWGVEETTDPNFTFADRIILDQLTDLRYLNRLDWDMKKLKGDPPRRNNITTKAQLDSLDWTEKLWSKGSFDGKLESDEKINDSLSGSEKKEFVFDYYLQYNDKSKAVEAVKIQDHSIMTFLIRSYYRYHIDFVAVLITLGAAALVLFFTAFKTAKLLWELAFHQFLALIFSASDLNTGQRIKAILKSMASIYMTIFLSVVLLKFYLMSSSFINSQNSLPTLVRAFILLFLALACIDGPNILERILGIDVGLKSGFHTAAAAFRGGQSIFRGAKAAGHAVSNAGKGVAGAASSFFSRKQNDVSGYSPKGYQGENISIYHSSNQRREGDSKESSRQDTSKSIYNQNKSESTAAHQGDSGSIYQKGEQSSQSNVGIQQEQNAEQASLYTSNSAQQSDSQTISQFSAGDSANAQSPSLYENTSHTVEKKEETKPASSPSASGTKGLGISASGQEKLSPPGIAGKNSERPKEIGGLSKSSQNPSLFGGKPSAIPPASPLTQNKDKLGSHGAKSSDLPINRDLASLSSDKKDSLYSKPLDSSNREPSGKTDHPNAPSLHQEPPVISFLEKGHAGSLENAAKPSIFPEPDSSQPEEQTLFPPELPDKPLEQPPENPNQPEKPKP